MCCDRVTAGGDTRADFAPLEYRSGRQLLRRRRSASTGVSFSDSYNPQYASVFRRMSTLHVHFLSCNWPVFFCSSLHVCRAKPAGVNAPLLELAPDAMQGQRFEVLLICFFFSCFKNQKYCSFKYCALHRIFCHKLVNIYIFFSIFRHILSYIQDNKMLLFSFVFFFCLLFVFREIPENVCCQVSTRARTVTVCFCVSVSVK